MNMVAPPTPHTPHHTSPHHRPRPHAASQSSHRFALVIMMAWGCVIAAADFSLAVQPQQWVHTTESDFEPGETENVVVTNLGDIKLAAETTTIGELPEDVSIIYDMVKIGDTTYIAAGPTGTVLAMKDGTITPLVTLENEQIFALLAGPLDTLLVAISGENSRIGVLQKDGTFDEAQAKFPEVRYIWDMIIVGDAMYVATGTDGKLWRVSDADPDAEPDQNNDNSDMIITEILETEQVNLLCLGTDAQHRIYVGTDTDGLIYRLTPRDDGTFESFVIYDAGEPEIGALLVRADGTVFAGTADADQARPGRLDEPVGEETGRVGAGNTPNIEGAGGGNGDGNEGGDEGVGDGGGDGGDGGGPPKPPGQPTPEPLDQTSAGGNSDDASGQISENDAMAADTTATVASAENAEETETSEAPEATEETAVAEAEVSAPTSEQLDRLRDVIRKRLQTARKTGAMQSPPGAPGRPNPGIARNQPNNMAMGRPNHGGGSAGAEGNAVYMIDPAGFVTEIFRESVMILGLATDNQDRILIATGNEGQIFRTDLTTDETTVLANLEPEQTVVMLLDEAGSAAIIGTANPASLIQLDHRVAAKGTFVSEPLDASQISLWGAAHLTATLPAGTNVAFETRSGNVADPDQAAWSSWSEPEQVNHRDTQSALAPRQTQIAAPPARFLQYRLTLSSDGKTSPAIDRVALSYLTPNLKPKIAALQVNFPELAPITAEQTSPEPIPAATIEWQAEDPNSDALIYALDYRPAQSQSWLPLADGLTGTSHEWALRLVPDGRYIVRVTASDLTNNPLDMAKTAVRLSDPVLVDTTPPTLKLSHEIVGNQVVITGKASDALSPIRSIRYLLPGHKTMPSQTNDSLNQAIATAGSGQAGGVGGPVLPDDMILDSTSETFHVSINGLSPGETVVMVEAMDNRQNTVRKFIIVTLPGL